MDDVRKHCEFGGMAGPVAKKVYLCLECGTGYEESEGRDEGMCQKCWNIYQGGEWIDENDRW